MVLPLKTHTEWTSDGERFSATMTYRNVTFEPGLEDDRFAFEPPENATLVESDFPDVRTFDSVQALRDAVSMPVPDPGVPQSFDLDTARSTSGRFRSVSLQYSNETATLSISVMNHTASNVTEGQRLTVDGREVVYQRFGTSQIVSWECDGWGYSVSGTAVGKNRLLEIATSIECSSGSAGARTVERQAKHCPTGPILNANVATGLGAESSG